LAKAAEMEIRWEGLMDGGIGGYGPFVLYITAVFNLEKI